MMMLNTLRDKFSVKKMISNKLFILSVFAFVPISSSLARTSSNEISRPSPSELEIIHQNKKLQQIEADEALKKPKEKVVIEEEKPKIKVNNEKKNLVKKITVYYGKIKIPQIKKDIKKITKPLVNTNMGTTEIFNLLRKISVVFFNKGFSTTYATLMPGNIKKEGLKINIAWGYVQGVLINGKKPESFLYRSMIYYAVPKSDYDLLNMHDIDQAIDNLNTLKQSARINIIASKTKPGFSFLNVILQKKKHPFSVNLSVENSNSDTSEKDQGEYRYSVDSGFSDVLFSLDTLKLSANKRYLKNRSQDNTKYFSINYTMPIGYNSSSFIWQNSNYTNTKIGRYGTHIANGSSTSLKIINNYILQRDSQGKIKLYSSLNYKSSADYLAGELIKNTSRPYFFLSLGVNDSTAFFGGTGYIDLSLSKGLNILGGYKDAEDRYGSPANFLKGNLNFYWSKNIKIMNKRIQYEMSINSQIGFNNLHSSNKLSFGGGFSVRGFKNYPFRGDNAIYMDNTLTIPGTVFFGWLILSPYVGLDGGYGYTNKKQISTATASIVGVKAYIEDFNIDVSLGYPLSYRFKPKSSATPISRYVFYLSAGLRL